MAIEIVYLAIKTSDFPVRYVNVYQRVTIPKRAVSEMVQCIQMRSKKDDTSQEDRYFETILAPRLLQRPLTRMLGRDR
jgi:hypothetical protein